MKNDKDNWQEEPDFSFDKKEKLPFGMPSDYFRSFEERLNSRIDTENELSEFPLLFSVPKSQTFGIPDGYFSETPGLPQHGAELNTHPVSEDLKTPVSNLQSTLIYRMSLQNELKPYETLYGLDKINHFTVADTYFDKFTDRLKEQIHAEKTARFSLPGKVLDAVFGKRIAWAFGLALIVGLAFWFGGKTQVAPENDDCKTLACLERDEILNNKAMTGMDEEQLMELVDVNSLKKQLKLGEAQQDSLTVKEEALYTIDVDELLDAI